MWQSGKRVGWMALQIAGGKSSRLLLYKTRRFGRIRQYSESPPPMTTPRAVLWALQLHQKVKLHDAPRPDESDEMTAWKNIIS
jgi:hypothetical protein